MEARLRVRSTQGLVGVVAALALLLSGCGGGDSDASAQATGTSTEPSTVENAESAEADRVSGDADSSGLIRFSLWNDDTDFESEAIAACTKIFGSPEALFESTTISDDLVLTDADEWDWGLFPWNGQGGNPTRLWCGANVIDGEITGSDIFYDITVYEEEITDEGIRTDTVTVIDGNKKVSLVNPSDTATVTDPEAVKAFIRENILPKIAY